MHITDLPTLAPARIRHHLVRAALLLIVFALAACGAPAQQAAPTAAPAAEKLRIAMIITGSAADGGWNSAGTDGLRQLREVFDAEVDYTELPPEPTWDQEVPESWEKGLRAYADQGYPLIFAHNRRFDRLVEKVAPDYPDIRFVVTGGTVSGPNYASVTLKNDEVGYTLGVLAGLMTKSNIVGVINGEQLIPFIATSKGFVMGVKAVNPDAEIIERVLPKTMPGTDVAPWSVPEGANAEAEELVELGADILFGRAAGANVGIIQVAQEHGVYAIAYGKDLGVLAPDTVLASGIQVLSSTMTRMTELFINGEFVGQNYLMGYTEDAVRMSPLREDLVPAEVRAKVDEAREQFRTGELYLEVER